MAKLRSYALSDKFCFPWWYWILLAMPSAIAYFIWFYRYYLKYKQSQISIEAFTKVSVSKVNRTSVNVSMVNTSEVKELNVNTTEVSAIEVNISQNKVEWEKYIKNIKQQLMISEYRMMVYCIVACIFQMICTLIIIFICVENSSDFGSYAFSMMFHPMHKTWGFWWCHFVYIISQEKDNYYQTERLIYISLLFSMLAMLAFGAPFFVYVAPGMIVFFPLYIASCIVFLIAEAIALAIVSIPLGLMGWFIVKINQYTCSDSEEPALIHLGILASMVAWFFYLSLGSVIFGFAHLFLFGGWFESYMFGLSSQYCPDFVMDTIDWRMWIVLITWILF
eukprot:518699_1